MMNCDIFRIIHNQINFYIFFNFFLQGVGMISAALILFSIFIVSIFVIRQGNGIKPSQL